MKSYKITKMKKILLIISIILLLTSCHKAKYKDVEKIKVGMTRNELFEIMPEKGWHSYDNGEYTYTWDYQTPDRYLKTFYVTMSNDIVTSTYSY